MNENNPIVSNAVAIHPTYWEKKHIDYLIIMYPHFQKALKWKGFIYSAIHIYE